MNRAFTPLCVLIGLAPPAVHAGATADYSRTPVLMVHGWFVSDLAGVATWATMKKNLVRDGWPEEYLDTPSFRDVRGCDPEHAEEIAGWVEALIARTGFERVDILAHSEGALNTLYYLKKLCGVHRVRKLVSLAGAFHGTVVACLDPFSCGAKEMCIPSTPGGWKHNEVLADLLACDETPGDVLYTTIWSPWDEIIVPQESSILDGAEVIQIETPFTEHGLILVSDEAYGYVREALLSGGANDDGPGWECLSDCTTPLPDSPVEAHQDEAPTSDDASPDVIEENTEGSAPGRVIADREEDESSEGDRTFDEVDLDIPPEGKRGPRPPPRTLGGCATSRHGGPGFLSVLLCVTACWSVMVRRRAGRAGR